MCSGRHWTSGAARHSPISTDGSPVGWKPAVSDELRLDAEELRLDAALQAGHHLEMLTEAQDQVTAAPLRERRWGLLALAQYQTGRQAEALRTLHRVRTVLANELGIDPSPDLVALEQAILRAGSLPAGGARSPGTKRGLPLPRADGLRR